MYQVVAQRQGAGLAGDPVAPDQERLRDALGSLLLRIGKAYAEPSPGAKQGTALRQSLPASRSP